MASAERLTVLFVLFFNLWISGKTQKIATIFYTEFSTRKVDFLSFLQMNNFSSQNIRFRNFLPFVKGHFDHFYTSLQNR